jgi:hypothetical protein
MHSRGRRKRHFKAHFTIEQCEQRRLLSISVSTVAGPFDVAGTHWEYASADGQGNTATYIETAAGPTTFNGQSCDQVNIGPTGASHSYLGYDGAGDFLEFGGFIQYPSGTMQTDTFTPTPSEPAQLDAGVTYSTTYTDVETSVSSTGTDTSSTTDTDTIMLVSDTTSPITVPAGTYDAYEVKTSETTVSPNSDGSTTSDTSTDDEWVVPGIGFIKATEYDQDGSVNATFNLSVFKIAGSKLAFIQQPQDTAIGDTIKPPVTVALEDASGNIQTNGTGSVLLNLNASGSSGTGALTGTLTEPVVNGIATFSNLSIDKGGTYTLAASDVASSPALPTTSSPFEITDGKLVFIKPPHNGSAGTKLNPGVIVELEDAKNKIITSEDGTVVTLATIGVTGGAALTGNTDVLSGGKATFPALVFQDPGTYTLQASDDAGDTAAVSSPFKIAGDKLVLSKVPATVDAGADFTMTVSLKDVKGLLVNSSDAIHATAVNQTNPSASSLSYDTTLVNGSSTFHAGLFTPGKYLITVTDTTAVSPGGTPEVTDATATVTVLGLHLAYRNVPKTVNAGDPFAFKVVLLDSKNKMVSDSDDAIQLTATPQTSTGVQFVAQSALVNGEKDFSATGSSFSIRVPGVYTQTVSDLTAPVTASGKGVASATVTLTVLGLHLAISKVPKSVDAGSPFQFRVGLQNSKGQIDTAAVDEIQSTATPQFDSTVQFVAQSALEDGVKDFTTGSDAFRIRIPGTYTETVSDLTFPADSTTGSPVQSATVSINVLPLQLVVNHAPRTAVAGKPFGFSVEVKDSLGRLDPDIEDDIQVNTVLTTDANVGYTHDDSLADGVRDFASAFVVPAAGVYTVTIIDSTAVASPDSAPPVASASFGLTVLAAKPTGKVVSPQVLEEPLSADGKSLVK